MLYLILRIIKEYTNTSIIIQMLTSPFAHIPRLDRRPNEIRSNNVFVQPWPNSPTDLYQHDDHSEDADRSPQRRHIWKMCFFFFFDLQGKPIMYMSCVINRFFHTEVSATQFYPWSSVGNQQSHNYSKMWLGSDRKSEPWTPLNIYVELESQTNDKRTLTPNR